MRNRHPTRYTDPLLILRAPETGPRRFLLLIAGPSGSGLRWTFWGNCYRVSLYLTLGGKLFIRERKGR